MKTDRRMLLGASFALTAGLVARPAGAGTLDTATRTWLRLVSHPDGRPVFSVEQGTVWGFKPQADDLTTEAFAKRLYGYWSLVARKADTTGEGVALTTKAWTFYTHPDTAEVVSEVSNPYTGEQVKCPPLSGPAFTAHYGGANTQAAAPLDLRHRRIGDRAFVEISRIARFKPKDTTWFKLEADFTSHACLAADLDKPGDGFIPSIWSHNVVAEWQTWMKMHGTPGHILFKGDGAALPGLSAAPRPLIAAVEAYLPGQLNEIRGWI